MKKKTIPNIYTPTIYYENESIDITKYCRDYMVKHNIHTNTIIENIFLLEKALEIYSCQKLINWKRKQNKEIDLENIESWMTLDGIIQNLNDSIPTDTQKFDYFVQYIHCIIYMLGKINKTNNFTKEEENSLQEVFTIERNQIILNPTISIHEVPTKMLEKIKEIYITKEKNPILKK